MQHIRYRFLRRATWLYQCGVFAGRVRVVRKIFAISFVVLGTGIPLVAESADGVIAANFERTVADGRDAEAAFQPERALVAFRNALHFRPNDAEILRLISKQLSDELYHIPEPSHRLAVEREAITVAHDALDRAPHDAMCIVAVAVCEGKLARDADIRERVASAREAKRYAEAALQADPHCDLAEHVLGVWNFEVSQVGAAKRALAKWFYGGIPDASLAEAAAHLQRAIQLAPQVVKHHIALGFVYAKSGDSVAARAEWIKGLALPSRDLPDETAKAAARVAMTRSG